MRKDEERNCIKCCSQTEYDVCRTRPPGLAMQRPLELDQSSVTRHACDSLTGKDYEECRAGRRGTERGVAGEKRGEREMGQRTEKKGYERMHKGREKLGGRK